MCVCVCVSQIVSESFLEDINNMLNSGEVPGMFAQDEKDRVCADIREWVIQQGGNATKVRMHHTHTHTHRHKHTHIRAMGPHVTKVRRWNR